MEAASDAAATERFKLVIVESDADVLKISHFLYIHRIVTVQFPAIFLLCCRLSKKKCAPSQISAPSPVSALPRATESK